jgi:hypothetical protein
MSDSQWPHVEVSFTGKRVPSVSVIVKSSIHGNPTVRLDREREDGLETAFPKF